MLNGLVRRTRSIAGLLTGSRATQPPDYILLAIVGAMIVVGILSIYSVSFGPNLQLGRDPFSMVLQHIRFVVIGLALMWLAMTVDYHLLPKVAVPLMIVTLLVLVAVLFVGQEVQGARRWVFGNSFQPSELAKIATIIYIATWTTSKGTKLRQLVYGLIPFGILVGMVAGLIYLEPNLSTALLIAVTAMVMFFIAGADLIQFTLLVVFGAVGAMFMIMRSAYAWSRLQLLWTDVFKVPSDQAWQLEQSLLALASGGFLGRGLGTGGSQYGFVPLAHSDGIFAVWGEEMGLIGTWLLVGLLLALTYRGFKIAQSAQDEYGRVLASGITFWLVFQAFVNIGVVTQLVPFTGQPLPLISYGGSSTISVLIAIGLLLGISRGRPAPAKVKARVRIPAIPRTALETKNATIDYRWRNRRARVPAVGGARRSRQRTSSRLQD